MVCLKVKKWLSDEVRILTIKIKEGGNIYKPGICCIPPQKSKV